MNEKFYVVATNTDDDRIAILDECTTRYEAECMLNWHATHRWLYAENVLFEVKSSTEWFK